jgi:hypothetical protein
MVWKEFTCSPSTKTWSGGSRRLTVAAYIPLNQGLPAFPGAQLIWKSWAPLRVQLNRACKGVFFSSPHEESTLVCIVYNFEVELIHPGFKLSTWQFTFLWIYYKKYSALFIP